ncbi:MAG: GIY-YIG nuclease family protein, partial [Anaerolineales bacterium]
MERSYFVYILSSATGTLYTGVTNDLERRPEEHRTGVGSKFTARYGVKRLVYWEETS